MKNFFDNIKLLIDDLFYETKEPVKNKDILLLARKLKKFRKTGASLEIMLDVARCLDPLGKLRSRARRFSGQL